MIEITPDNVIEYLKTSRRLPARSRAQAEPLAWGVSNVVIRVSTADGPDFVVKQSRKQLRTQAEWFSRLERIHTEIDAMIELNRLLPDGVVPSVLFEDRANYLFGMEAVPADHRVWKAELLAGVADQKIARMAGDLLATIHRETAQDPDLAERFGDLTVFDELRVDPFYRFVLHRHPELGEPLEIVIRDVLTIPTCLVLADFSPKNILLTGDRIALVDFETAHFGDPAFDLGFFLSHLLLKTIKHADNFAPFLQLAREFWDIYSVGISHALDLSKLERRSVANLGGCLLARIDGKSPIDYFDQLGQKETARRLAFTYLMQPIRTIAQAFAEMEQILTA